MKKDTIKVIRKMTRRMMMDAGAYDGRFREKIVNDKRSKRSKYGYEKEDSDP